MTPVDQTTFGDRKGNCLAACVATLLNLTIDDVPEFTLAPDAWLITLREWLLTRGYYPICFVANGAWIPDGLYILAGKSPRGEFLHAVIARGNDIIHDPHPSRAGVLTRVDGTIIVPLDPTHVWLHGCVKV